MCVVTVQVSKPNSLFPIATVSFHILSFWLKYIQLWVLRQNVEIGKNDEKNYGLSVFMWISRSVGQILCLTWCSLFKHGSWRRGNVEDELEMIWQIGGSGVSHVGDFFFRLLNIQIGSRKLLYKREFRFINESLHWEISFDSHFLK